MRETRIVRICLLVAGFLMNPATPDPRAEPTPDGEPREIGLTERTERRLAQIDVTVSGRAEAIADLGREDFEVVVAGRFIEEFVVDALCPPPERPADLPEPAETPERPAERPIPRPPATYLFYFDQLHLTMEGRQNSLDTARQLIPELIVGGNRATIVSCGEQLVTFADLTTDVPELLLALDRVQEDGRAQFDPYSELETSRIDEVLGALSGDDGSGANTNRAIVLARGYQQEERWRTEKALRLFSTVLARLADLDPPKAAVYFADTMRKNAGEHYMRFFGRSGLDREIGLLSKMELDSFTAHNPFDNLVQEAAAHGIRIYPVQAQGMTTGESVSIGSRGRNRVGQNPQGHRLRVADAQDSLLGLAQETGGQAFLNGVRPSKIVERIRQDLACLYLISFDPAGLPEDEPLPVLVRMKRPKVEARVRGQILLQSASRRKTSRLLAAFAAPRAVEAESPLRSVVIPTGFEAGAYTALVQIAVPGSPLSGARWDVGASLVARGRVREDTSGHVEISGPGVDVVFESEMSFPPGPYQLIAVAHETTADRIVSRKLDGEWPDPDDAPVTLGPFAAVQPASGAFLRDGRLRTSGALGRDDEELLRTWLPTALVGLVCKDGARRKGLRVARRLVGETAVDFPVIELEFEDDRCVQILDRIPAGTLTEGRFSYEVQVLGEKGELTAGSLEFVALGEEPGEASARPAGGVDATPALVRPAVLDRER